jgi:hypothetical protein
MSAMHASPPASTVLPAPQPPAAAPPQPGDWRRAYLLLYGGYILLSWTTRLTGWWNGDAIWFVWAARNLVHGSWDLYGLRLGADLFPPEGITYSYPPLLAIIVSPFVGLAYALGWGDDGAYRLMGLPLVLFDVLALEQMRRLVREWRPALSEWVLFLGVVLALFITGFFMATAYKGHVEGLLFLFILLTLRLLPRHLLLAGLTAGLALATKHTTTTLALLPIGFVLLAGGRGVSVPPTPAQRRRGLDLSGLRAALLWGSIAVGVLILFMLPPTLTEPSAVYYAFVLLPTHLVIGGPGLPRWVDLGLQSLVPTADYPRLHDLLITNANAVLLLAAVVVPAVLTYWARRVGHPIGLRDHRLVGLIALNLALGIVLGKWATDLYFPVPLAFLFIWDTVRTPGPLAIAFPGRDSFPWVAVGAALAYRTVTQVSPTLEAPFAQFVWPWFGDFLVFLLFVALAGLLLGQLTRLAFPPSGAEQEPSTP